MKNNSSNSNKAEPQKDSILPISTYWSLDLETDGRSNIYQFSSSIEMITGFSADYFSAGLKQWLGVVHPEDRQGVFDFLSNLMTREGSGVLEYRIMRPDGVVRWVSDCATSIRLPDHEMRLDGAISDVTERKQAEDLLKRSNQQLALWINELQERKSKMDQLEHISAALEPCSKLEEVGEVLVKYVGEVFPSQPGALYYYDTLSNRLKKQIAWGDFESEDSSMPDACQAWLSGKPHVSSGTNSRSLCKHDRGSARENLTYLCAPLIAQGQRVGIFYLRRETNDFSKGERYDSVDYWKSMAMMIAERLAYVILNLKLRQDLTNQSVRDSLTGVYIRRYFEENLRHEISRAVRYKRRIGLMLVDIDHLAQINEADGYSAGNAVLQAFGKFLLSKIRSSDVVCRYGEDEFMLLLSEASLEDTAKRAELFRMEGKNLRILFGGHHLKSVTLSLGVAAYPEHGETIEELLQSAENALALAKARGCDQVMVSNPAEEIGT